MRTICLCNSNIPWGGGETWHLQAARSLAARGWRVFLLCHPQGELYRKALREPNATEGSFDSLPDSCPACPGKNAPATVSQAATGDSSPHSFGGSLTVLPLALSRLSFLNPLVSRKLSRFFQREQVHAVIMNLPADLKVAGPAAKTAKVPHIIYRRGSALSVRDSIINRYLYGKTLTRLIVNSEATRRMVLVNNPDLIPASRITVLPNGFDIAAFDANLEAARKRLEKPPSPFVIGNAGRLNKQKGQHLLLRLGKLLRDQGLDCKVVIAGTGEREAELKALAEDFGIVDRVEFRGFMPDLAPFWLELDVFVLTSLWEGFGNVLLEAMLAEKPVLAFAVSNLPELVQDGVNGRLFPLPRTEQAHCPAEERTDPSEDAFGCVSGHSTPPGKLSGTDAASPADAGSDSDAPLRAMAACLLELAGEPELRRRMGTAGRTFALGFSQDSAMDKLEALLADRPRQ